jgi:DNA topoisomerase-3
MRLFIAEKPSLGRAIAQYLPVKGTPKGPAGKPPTHIVAGDDVVTWCFGHLLEMAQPEDYSEAFKKWDFELLPMVPDEWRLIPKDDAKGQIKAIKDLLAEADEVVNAGDPDREGQLLVDELLEHLGNKRPVKRIWLAALDETNVRKALADLRDNAGYQNLKASAEARQRGDWLVGMNLTRAYTLAGRQSGYDGVLSIGRVQTPTLALVVNRDLAIENFKPKDFFGVTASIKAAGGAFSARWKPSDAVPVDDAGRVLDRAIADGVAAKVAGQAGQVAKFEASEKKQAAPLPFSLSSLQAAANKKLGLSAQDVLDVAQELYEAKLTTYPRTDCNYLPEAQLGDAAAILAGLPDDYAELVKQADPSLKSAAWNDKKITAHHAIIPTGQRAELKGKQAQVFDLIVRAYLAQFFPAHTYRQTSIVLDVAGETFTASGKVPLSPGWKVVFGAAADEDEDAKDEDKDDKQTLPALKNGEAVACESAKVEGKKTTPPARFTEGTLIQAMTNIHQLVEDPELKKRLKETAGIGTEATRAGILETLKKRGFIAEKGKQIISTDPGRKLIIALPDAVKSPGLTGLFEQVLDGIAEGRVTPAQFLAKQLEYVSKYVEQAKGASLGLAAAHPCPVCKEGHLRRRTSDKGPFWGCSRYQEGCKTSFPDKAGKPDFAPKKPAGKKPGGGLGGVSLAIPGAKRKG